MNIRLLLERTLRDAMSDAGELIRRNAAGYEEVYKQLAPTLTPAKTATSFLLLYQYIQCSTDSV